MRVMEISRNSQLSGFSYQTMTSWNSKKVHFSDLQNAKLKKQHFFTFTTASNDGIGDTY